MVTVDTVEVVYTEVLPWTVIVPVTGHVVVYEVTLTTNVSNQWQQRRQNIYMMVVVTSWDFKVVDTGTEGVTNEPGADEIVSGLFVGDVMTVILLDVVTG